jgi:hypothetical protein
MAKGKKTGGRDIKKGEVRNPWGRPKKGESLTELMKAFLEGVPPDKKKTYKQLFIMKVYKKAMDGDIAAIKMIWNYVDGMPQQKMDVTSQGDKLQGFNILPPADDKKYPKADNKIDEIIKKL